MESDDVLTGQIPLSTPNNCRRHREVAHDAEGSPEKTWCNYCGWTTADGGKRMAPANGGWA